MRRKAIKGPIRYAQSVTRLQLGPLTVRMISALSSIRVSDRTTPAVSRTFPNPVRFYDPSPLIERQNEPLEPSKPTPPHHPFKRLREKILERLANSMDATQYLEWVAPSLSPPFDIRTLPAETQLRVCLVLLLSASKLLFLGDQSLFESTDSSLHSSSHTTPPASSAWAVAQAKAVWDAVDYSKVLIHRRKAYYHIIHAQLLALEGHPEEAEKEMEPYLSLRDKLRARPSWIVFNTLRIIFFMSNLQRRPLKDALHLYVQRPGLMSFIVGNHVMSAPHVTRKYSSLLRKHIFEVLDQLSVPHSWYTSIAPDPANDGSYNRKEHRALGILLLHHLLNRLHAIRLIDSATSGHSSLAISIMQMLDTFNQSGYSVPFQLKVQCSLELNRCGYAEEAERHLNDITTASRTNATFKTSALLAVAARRGDIIRALDLVETLQRTSSMQKRDIRQLMLAYTRAPAYELGPVGKESANRGTYSLQDGSLEESAAIPDRIADAEEIFSKLLAPHHPSIFDYVVILNAYAKRGDIEKVNSWIKRMLDGGIPPEDIPWEKALRAFAVAGNVEGVVRILDHIQEVQTRRRIKEGGDPGHVEGEHRWSNVMNKTVFDILLELMVRRRDPLSANRLWRNVVFAGYVKSNFSSAVKLLRAHAEAGHWIGVIKAWRYIETMERREQSMPSDPTKVSTFVPPHRDTAVYNTVLRAYVALGTPLTTVMGLVERMWSLGVTPDSFTYTMAIISATDDGDMDLAMSLFQQMEDQEARRWLPPGLQQAVSAISLRRGPSTIDYRPIYALTYLLRGYLRQKQWPQAHAVYHLIKQRGLRLLPFTYAVIIKSYLTREARGDNDEGLQVAEDFLNSLKSDWESRDLSEDEAALMGKESPPHRVTTYSPLMIDYVRRRKPEEVERLFEQMVQIGGQASIGGLTMLMDVYRRVGDVDRVRETWRTVLRVAMDTLEKDDLARQISSLSEGGGGTAELLTADNSLNFRGIDRHNHPRSSRALLCYPFSVFMDAVSAAGSHEEVALQWKQLRDAGFSFDAHNWNHLVTALVRAGELERAFEVVEKVIIPYALSSKLLVSGTQLPWEMSESEEKEVQPLVDDEGVRWGRRRVAMQYESAPGRRVALEAAGPGDPSDFLHELELMQGVSRNWYQWKPHKKVLRTLARALLHLESGRLVPPLLPPGVVRDNAEDTGRNSEEAYVLLEKIHTQYPRTSKLAYDQVPMLR